MSAAYAGSKALKMVPLVGAAVATGLTAYGVEQTTSNLIQGNISVIEGVAQYDDQALGASFGGVGLGPAGLAMNIFSSAAHAQAQIDRVNAIHQINQDFRMNYEAALAVQSNFMANGLLPRTSAGTLDVANMTADQREFTQRLFETVSTPFRMSTLQAQSVYAANRNNVVPWEQYTSEHDASNNLWLSTSSQSQLTHAWHRPGTTPSHLQPPGHYTPSFMPLS